jgi:hypothetical protein
LVAERHVEHPAERNDHIDRSRLVLLGVELRVERGYPHIHRHLRDGALKGRTRASLVLSY